MDSTRLYVKRCGQGHIAKVNVKIINYGFCISEAHLRSHRSLMNQCISEGRPIKLAFNSTTHVYNILLNLNYLAFTTTSFMTHVFPEMTV